MTTINDAALPQEEYSKVIRDLLAPFITKHYAATCDVQVLWFTQLRLLRTGCAALAQSNGMFVVSDEISSPKNEAHLNHGDIVTFVSLLKLILLQKFSSEFLLLLCLRMRR